MNFNHLTLSSILICTLLLVLSCSKNSVSEDDEQISGLYKAIAFSEPGEKDGGVDILASGGMLTVRLLDNFELEGHIRVPSDIGSNFAPIDDDFNGTFTLTDVRVHFINTGTFFDHDPWLFVVKDGQLRTPEWTGRLAPTEIILEKQ